MKPSSIIPIMILLICTSCATLDVNEIQNLSNKVEFEPLQLIPGWETNDLRVDLIRQTSTEKIGEIEEDVATLYNPIGFDLGNGLFFDLRENLSIKLDYLLDYSPENDFEIKTIFSPTKNGDIVVFRFKNDSLTISNPKRNKPQYVHHLVKLGDSVAYMDKNQLRYAIVETDTSLVCTGKRRVWDAIRKVDANHYYQDSRIWKVHYEIKGNDIFLGSNYIVSLRNNNTTLEIKSRRINKVWLLYTIERSKDQIFIYDNKHYGKKIKLSGNSVEVYQNSTLSARYELQKAVEL